MNTPLGSTLRILGSFSDNVAPSLPPEPMPVYTAVAPPPSMSTEKRDKLEAARVALKREFFGIDEQIDRIISSIKTWYLMPEIVTRPLLVSLWSLTGCGKTSLVRSLVSHLGLGNKFLEIQMDGINSGPKDSEITIMNLLKESSIDEGEGGVILLDEFQRFRTRDDMGNDLKVERYHDVWMLLSDGKFPCDCSKLKFIASVLADKDHDSDTAAFGVAVSDVYSALYRKMNPTEEGAKTDMPDPRYSNTDTKISWLKYHKVPLPTRRYTVDDSLAKRIKTVLRCPESVEDIMCTWTEQRFLEELRSLIRSNENRSFDYSKCLVFVAGNLDEAFRMAGEVEDCDTGADIYHDHTKKVGPIEVKIALTRRFRPEQIARLGNNHVVYPSLNAEAYMNLIRRSCREYTDQASRFVGVEFTIDNNLYQEIYENSVYPAQGTRPVFTSIHKIFGSPLSDAIFWARERGHKQVTITIDIATSSVVFKGSSEELSVKVDLDIRERRKSNSDDFNAMVAVHEAGHAIVYAELFKTAPSEIAISVASFKGGYNRYSGEMPSKQQVMDRVCVTMSGIVAEELIFGQELRSTGCASDIQNATKNAAAYVRDYGMDGFNSFIYSEHHDSRANTDVAASNKAIEVLITDQKNNAQTILTAKRDLLIRVSRHLISVKKMTGEEFVTFVGDAIPGLQPPQTKDVTYDYAARLARS